MARENRDQWSASGTEGDARRASTPPDTPEGARGAGGAKGPSPTGSRGVPSPAVPAQRAGRPATPPPAPPVGAPPPPTPPPVTQSPQSAVPFDDPGATGRSGGSRTHAPAVPPAAPRGRDTTDRPGDGSGPGPGDGGGHDVSGAGGSGTGTGHEPAAGGGDGPAGQLLGDGERDRLGQRMHHALAGFVDSPHDAVAEAADVLAEAEQQLIASLRDRRAALRAGWQENGDPDGPGPDTEQLRLTLRTYREVTERLLRA